MLVQGLQELEVAVAKKRYSETVNKESAGYTGEEDSSLCNTQVVKQQNSTCQSRRTMRPAMHTHVGSFDVPMSATDKCSKCVSQISQQVAEHPLHQAHVHHCQTLPQCNFGFTAVGAEETQLTQNVLKYVTQRCGTLEG